LFSNLIKCSANKIQNIKRKQNFRFEIEQGTMLL
jgi:hypothetical protein